jgi:hypothetical protein
LTASPTPWRSTPAARSGLTVQSDRSDCRDHIHELELLPLHITRKQMSRIRSEFEKAVVQQFTEFATDRPYRVK